MADSKQPVAAKPTNDIVAQVAERVKSSANVLIALSKDPSVDELAAAIGLTFMLDKMGKHATAIFSGAVPNAIEFLEPEKTFEVNTNSLQDFIIALNKEKADHLRYKIEGDYVKVFITPYKTTIDESDLEFSHGDFNVDLVMALDVADVADLDKSLAEHGRIMHDASAINITTGTPGKFGDIEWSDPGASSVSEMVGMLGGRLKAEEILIDKPIATALLAGIVAATSRFSNEKTTPATMSMASSLMAAGADQQLISSSIPVEFGGTAVAEPEVGVSDEVIDAEKLALEEPKKEEPEVVEPEKVEEDDPSRLIVSHDDEKTKSDEPVEKPEDKIEVAPVVAEPESQGPEAVPQMPEPVGLAAPELVLEPLEDGGEQKEENKPAEVKPEEARAETPEQQLEKIIQAPGGENSGPLMDELREVAGEKVLEPVDDEQEEVKPDYAALIEKELGAPLSQAEAKPAENVAAGAAPSVPSVAEINGVPNIDYGQAPEVTQSVAAPTPISDAVVTPSEPVVSGQVVEPQPVVVPEAPVAVEPVQPTSPLPMPGSDGILPPPPPPFDPSAPVGAVDFSPTPPVMPTPVVAAPVAPIEPAAPVVAEQKAGYLGSNPAMQDQIYPQENRDPGAFQIPTAA
jgi:hypothetical protein